MKEQKIVVLLTLTPSDRMLILNGLKIASLFRKELCLLFNFSKKEKKYREEYKKQLIEYSLPIKNEVPGLKISTLLLSENLAHLPEKLSDDFEAIFIVAPSSQFAKYSKAVTESPVPFLFVDENRVTVPEYKNLILPIDLRKEISDSALWSSYFGRFNGAEIVVVAANDKDRDDQKQVAKNVVLSKKLFQKFKIPHKIFRGQKSSLGNAFEALELAHTINADFLTILSSSTITPLDLLVGLPERKIIKKAGNLPVMVINPRKDNYILCD
jgi:hypothetical protein